MIFNNYYINIAEILKIIKYLIIILFKKMKLFLKKNIY